MLLNTFIQSYTLIFPIGLKVINSHYCIFYMSFIKKPYRLLGVHVQ